MILNGKSKIDCMYLINQLDDQPNNTILFCNPNGGYYEYMFYDVLFINISSVIGLDSMKTIE